MLLIKVLNQKHVGCFYCEFYFMLTFNKLYSPTAFYWLFETKYLNFILFTW